MSDKGQGGTFENRPNFPASPRRILLPLLAVLMVALMAGCQLLGRGMEQAPGAAREAAATFQARRPTLEAAAATAAVQARDLAERAADGSSSALATLQAVRPTAEVAMATAAVQARAAATRIAEGGSNALATVQAYGTPAITIRDRLASMRPDQNGIFVITVSEAELTHALTWHRPAEEDGMENSRARIANGEIVISSEVSVPVRATAQIAFAPRIEDGQFRLEATSGSLGVVPLPGRLLQSAENRINATLLAAVDAVPGTVIFTHATAENGQLTLIGYRGR